jgi:hypothetical protein
VLAGGHDVPLDHRRLAQLVFDHEIHFRFRPFC